MLKLTYNKKGDVVIAYTDEDILYIAVRENQKFEFVTLEELRKKNTSPLIPNQ
jgi:hypothetical protein